MIIPVRTAQFQLVALAFLFAGTLTACRRTSIAGEPIQDTDAPRFGRTVAGILTLAGVQRGYRLHLPPAPEAGVPLVVSLHGLGGSAASQEALTGASALADREGFAVVYPEGEVLVRSQGWRVTPGSDDVEFIRRLVEALQEEHNLDLKRVYVVGHSNGGGLVHRLMCDAGDVFAAAASVAGAYLWQHSCQPVRPVPLIAFHSLDDPIVPYTGSAQTPDLVEWAAVWAERNGCSDAADDSEEVSGVFVRSWLACPTGAEVLLFTLDGVGHGWPGSAQAGGPVDATAVIWSFFKRYTLSGDQALGLHSLSSPH